MLITHNTQLPHIHTLLQSLFPNTLNTQMYAQFTQRFI